MSYFEERLESLKSAVLYLNENNEFDKVQNICEDNSIQEQCTSDALTEQKGLIYNFIVNIDLGSLLEHDSQLGNKLLQSIGESSNLFQEVLYEHCQANQLLPSYVTSTQICTTLRVSHFPISLLSLQVQRVRDLTRFVDYPGLLRLVGVVTGLSGAAKYTQSTKYICPNDGCDGHTGNKYIRTHVPGASEMQTIRSDFRCRFCTEILEEVKSSRILSDKMMAEVSPVKLVGCSQREVFDTGRVQAVPVIIRDDLVEKVVLGKTYEIIGISRSDVQGESIAVGLEANNIIKIDKPSCMSVSQLPKTILEAYKGTKTSPWRFPFYMAYRFGEQVVSRGAALKLKLVLLISLVLDPKAHTLHTLCVGRELGLVTSLMTLAATLTPRSFPVSVTTPLTAKARKNCQAWMPYFMQAGSLPLSCGGVCPLGDLGAWSKQRRDQLHTVLSSRKMFVELPSKGQSCLPSQEVVPLTCHTWAVYDPSSAPLKANKSDLLMPAAETGALGKTLLDSFSYIAFIDAGEAASQEETVIETAVHTLVSWTSDGVEGEMVDYEHWEKYLHLARSTEAVMTVEAETLLHNYYMAARMARSSGLNGSDVPTSALSTLACLAVGVAKLKLQTVVSEEDAVLAVYLMEESLTARFGLSVLNVQPQPHVPETQIPGYLGHQLDSVLQHFHKQLVRFCSQVMQSRWPKMEE